MIRYKRGGVWTILNLFKLHGSTFPYTTIIALPCAIASGLLQSYYPKGDLRIEVLGFRDDGGIMSESQAWAGFSFLVGFLIVFRTSQAYGRFWEGCTASHQMRAEWFDACSSLASFCKASDAPPEHILHFKSLLVCLTSMLHAQALAALESGDSNEDESSEADLMAWNYQLIDPGAVDAESIETIKKSEHRVELLFEWIQQVVVENIGTGVLSIPAPILSRSFQELANGMVAYHNAMKISHIPFPFPYAQSCDCLLVFHYIVVPFVTSQWVSSPWWAGIFTFIQVFILWSLNLIAIQIDNPFGRDHNDIDAARMQEEINAHLNLLLDPSTERTPRLTRPLHDIGLSKDVASAMAARKFGVGEGAGGEGAETILPRPRRNSFVDLFRDEELQEMKTPRGTPRNSHQRRFAEGFGASLQTLQSAIPVVQRGRSGGANTGSSASNNNLSNNYHTNNNHHYLKRPGSSSGDSSGSPLNPLVRDASQSGHHVSLASQAPDKKMSVTIDTRSVTLGTERRDDSSLTPNGSSPVADADEGEGRLSIGSATSSGVHMHVDTDVEPGASMRAPRERCATDPQLPRTPDVAGLTSTPASRILASNLRAAAPAGKAASASGGDSGGRELQQSTVGAGSASTGRAPWCCEARITHDGSRVS